MHHINTKLADACFNYDFYSDLTLQENQKAKRAVNFSTRNSQCDKFKFKWDFLPWNQLHGRGLQIKHVFRTVGEKNSIFKDNFKAH